MNHSVKSKTIRRDCHLLGGVERKHLKTLVFLCFCGSPWHAQTQMRVYKGRWTDAASWICRLLFKTGDYFWLSPECLAAPSWHYHSAPRALEGPDPFLFHAFKILLYKSMDQHFGGRETGPMTCFRNERCGWGTAGSRTCQRNLAPLGNADLLGCIQRALITPRTVGARGLLGPKKGSRAKGMAWGSGTHKVP